MTQESRSFLAILLSVAFLVGYSLWMRATRPPVTQPAPAPLAESQVIVPYSQPIGSQLTPAEKTSPPAVTVASPLWEGTFDNQGRLLSFKLAEYTTSLKEKTLVDLVPSDGLSGPRYLDVLLAGEEIDFNYQGDGKITLTDPGRIVFRGQSSSGRLVTKTVYLDPNSYLQKVTVEFENPAEDPFEGETVILWGPTSKKTKESRIAGFSGGVVMVNEKRRTIPFTKLTEPTVFPGPAYIGVESRYFLTAFLPGDPDASGFFSPLGENEAAGGVSLPLQAPPGGTGSRSVEIYLGPKVYSLLKEAGPGLEKTIDLGFFSWLATPFYLILRTFHSVVGNYGLAIILLTIIIKLLLTPITHKQYQSMHRMQALQPKIKRLREKYKKDPQRLNQETMLLYREQGVNPLGGCLPMVIQIPVFWALYKVLLEAIELRQEPFLYLKDLAAPDPIYLSPILMGVSMYFQQRLTTASVGDKKQAQMMSFMPLIFTLFFLKFPSGLVIYWLVNNLLTVIYSLFFMKK